MAAEKHYFFNPEMLEIAAFLFYIIKMFWGRPTVPPPKPPSRAHPDTITIVEQSPIGPPTNEMLQWALYPSVKTFDVEVRTQRAHAQMNNLCCGAILHRLASSSCPLPPLVTPVGLGDTNIYRRDDRSWDCSHCPETILKLVAIIHTRGVFCPHKFIIRLFYDFFRNMLHTN